MPQATPAQTEYERPVPVTKDTNKAIQMGVVLVMEIDSEIGR